MKLAYTISSYRLYPFVRLGVSQIKALDPEADILISDDPSPESNAIKEIAGELGVVYRSPTKRRGHFAGDFQSLVTSLAFAEASKADIAIKVSQRFIFRKPESIDVIRKTFSDPNICVATPGKPNVKGGFGAFSTLSDIVMIRVGCMKPEELLHMYRSRILREKVPWASFIECTVDELHHSKFPGRTVKIEELTNPTKDPIYLRRYQATEQQYRDLALANGFNGLFPTGEWGQIEGRNYLARPIVV